MMKWLREEIQKAGLWNSAIISGIAILFFLSLVGFFFEWFSLKINDSHEAKLQAVASVLGNALGVIGAVIAVLIGIKLNESKEKEDIKAKKQAIRLSIIAKFGMVEELCTMTEGLMNDPESTVGEIHEAHAYSKHITWSDVTAHTDIFVKIDVLLPYAFQQLILRETLLKEAFYLFRTVPGSVKIQALGIDNADSVMLVKIRCVDYIRALIFFGDYCGVEFAKATRAKFGMIELKRGME